MHYISKIRNGAFLIALSGLLFTSCKRNPTISSYFNSDDNGGYASDASRIEWANEDAISLADAAGTYYNSKEIADSASGVHVGPDTLSTMHQLNIDFGTTDVVCLDGRKRRGTITIQYYGEYTDSLQPHTITFINYYVNDNQLSGRVTVTRIDTTVAGNWYYNEHVSENMIIDQSGNSQDIIWDGSLVRKWVSGFGTATRTDDVFSISGQVNLTRGNGNLYGFSIATPLQFALDCNFAESGLVNVSGYNGTRILNYGSGSRDAAAQVTLSQDSSIHNIQLTQ